MIRLAPKARWVQFKHSFPGDWYRWGDLAVCVANEQGMWHISVGIGGKAPADYPWFPDAMLRDPYPGADLPCVGEDYEIVAAQEDKNG